MPPDLTASLLPLHRASRGAFCVSGRRDPDTRDRMATDTGGGFSFFTTRGWGAGTVLTKRFGLAKADGLAASCDCSVGNGASFVVRLLRVSHRPF